MIFAATVAADKPDKPPVPGFTQENVLLVICVFGVNEMGSPLHILKYLIGSETTGVGLILYVNVCVLVQPFCATILTSYSTSTGVDVVLIRLSLIKFAVPEIALVPSIAALFQVQPSLFIGIVDPAEKLILLPQPTETLFQVAVLLMVGLGKTVTTIVYLTPRLSNTV